MDRTHNLHICSLLFIAKLTEIHRKSNCFIGYVIQPLNSLPNLGYGRSGLESNPSLNTLVVYSKFISGR